MPYYLCAATICAAGCNTMLYGRQPFVMETATLCCPDCSLSCAPACALQAHAYHGRAEETKGYGPTKGMASGLAMLLEGVKLGVISQTTRSAAMVHSTGHNIWIHSALRSSASSHRPRAPQPWCIP